MCQIVIAIKIQGYGNKLKIYTVPVRIHFHEHAHFMATTDTHFFRYKHQIIKIKALHDLTSGDVKIGKVVALCIHMINISPMRNC